MFDEEKVSHGGTEYTIQPPNVKTRGLFATYLEQRAIEFVRRHKKDYGEDYLGILERLARKGGGGGFTWGTEAWAEALNNDEGFQELAFLVLRQSHPEIDRALVAEMWETPAKVIDPNGDEIDGKLGGQIAQKIMRLVNRPNSPRPDAAPGGR